MIAIIALGITLTACGSDLNTNGADFASTSSTLSIDGYWTANCHAQSGNSGYVSGHLKIYSNTMHADLSTSLTDVNCATADLLTSVDSTFKISGPVTVPPNSYALDSIISSLKVTPVTTAVASALNSKAYCGLTNWQAGVSQEIGNLTCAGTSSSGHTNYGVVSLSGSTLFFGLPSGTNDGSRPARRPTALNLVDFYTM